MKHFHAAISIAVLTAVPAVRAEAPTPPPPALTDTSYWIGGTMPEPMAGATFDFLTGPTGPLGAGFMTSFQGAFFLFNNTRGESGKRLYNAEKSWNGYTLLSAIGGAYQGVNQAILIDMEGNVVKAWPLRVQPAKMLPNGDVIAGAGTPLEGHVELARLVQLDWCGKEVWSWAGDKDNPPPGGARWHHDFQREGSSTGYYSPTEHVNARGGKTLLLVHENPPLADTGAVSTFPLEEDAFYEIDRDGRVSWSWRPWQHVDQLGFDAHARAAIQIRRVSDPGFVGGGATETDWQHVNSLSWVGPNKWYDEGDERFNPDNLIWDGRSTNIIAIVARHDHPDGKTWKEGDVVWRLGPNFDAAQPEHRIGQIIGQHHAHIIPDGLPGAGNLLVFDNGGLAGFGDLFPGMAEKYSWWPNKYRNYSRILEINPVTYEIVWQYVQPEDTTAETRKFFSWFISSAQRLANGNTMITEGANGRVFEVTAAGEIVWEYISPFNGGNPVLRNATYRAYRVPASYLPLNRTCPQNGSNAGGNKK